MHFHSIAFLLLLGSLLPRSFLYREVFIRVPAFPIYQFTIKSSFMLSNINLLSTLFLFCYLIMTQSLLDHLMIIICNIVSQFFTGQGRSIFSILSHCSQQLSSTKNHFFFVSLMFDIFVP